MNSKIFDWEQLKKLSQDARIDRGDTRNLNDNISLNVLHECENYKYQHEGGYLRTPNDKEIRSYAMRLLRDTYYRQGWIIFNDVYDSIPINMSLQTYHTMKGQIRHGHINVINEYLRKRGVYDFIDRIDEYAKNKCIFCCTIDVTFKKPVKLFMAEISLGNKEE